jgi:hypothetical protein
LLVCALLASPLAAGTGKKEARYVGGSFVEVEPGTEGRVTLETDAIRFDWGGKSFRVPYSSITSLEYGQKSGRRIGATVALGVTTLGIGALPMLLSKKRKHFATIGFTSANGKTEGILVEFGKDMNRTALSTMSIKSGAKIEFETAEAEKEFRH